MDNKHIDLLGESCLWCGRGDYVEDPHDSDLVLCLVCKDLKERITTKSEILRSRSEKPVED